MKQRQFQPGDVVTFLQEVRYRLDKVSIDRRPGSVRFGKPMAEMTMIVDDLGHKGEWKQLGGPSSLEGAILVSPNESEEPKENSK